MAEPATIAGTIESPWPWPIRRPERAEKPPIRVLHVLGSLERGGVETWLLNLLASLDRSSWQFDFCTLGPHSGRYAGVARARGGDVLPCPLGTGRGPATACDFAARFYRLLRAGRYQVVHSHVHHFSSFVLGVAQAAGVPVRVAHSHNTHDGASDTWRRRLYLAAASRLLAKTATLPLACSRDAVAPLFGRRFGRRSNKDSPVRIVHYGLSEPLTAAPLDTRLRWELGLAGGAPVIGHVGRFDRQKNHEFLLKVAAVIQPRRPDLRWLLVGEGERRREIERRARALGLSQTIVFCERREDISALLVSAMDLFLLPSLYEGLPLVLLEAQAAGLRSLASARVTREAAAVEGAVEFLPLEAGPGAWAERALDLLARGRLPVPFARRELESAGFTIGHSLQTLLAAYRSGLVCPGNVRPGNAGLGSAGPGNAGPGNAGPGSVGPGSGEPGSREPGSGRPGNFEPGNSEPGN